jgi:hypothetical protein
MQQVTWKIWKTTVSTSRDLVEKLTTAEETSRRRFPGMGETCEKFEFRPVGVAQWLSRPPEELKTRFRIPPKCKGRTKPNFLVIFLSAALEAADKKND